MFDNVSVNPEVIEFVAGVFVPAVLAVLLAGLGVFGLKKIAEQVVGIWRIFYPLVNDASDPIVIAGSKMLHMTPEQLVTFIAAWNAQIDPPQETIK